MPDAGFDLTSTYVHLRPDGGAAPIAVDERFWATIADRRELDEGYLVTRGRSTEDWPHWEVHPEGEELVVVLSGRIDLQLDDERRQWTVPLRAGQAWINPRGVWHRALVREPADMLFITAGRGTRHRPL